MKKILFFLTLFLLTAGMSYAQNVAKIGTTEYTTLQAALDAAYATTSDVTIEMTADYTGFGVVRQKAGQVLTIDGGNNTLNGQIILTNNSGTANTGLVIENFNFVLNTSEYTLQTETSGIVFVPLCNNKGNAFWRPTQTTSWWQTNGITGIADFNNYVKNVTIRNCNFDMPPVSSGTEVVAIKGHAGNQKIYNLVLDNITATGGHSFLQLNTGKTTTDTALIINNCTYNNDTHNGINLTGGDNSCICVIRNSTISADDGYGIRVQNGGAKTIYLSDNNLTAPEGLVLKNTSETNIYISSGTLIGPIDNQNPASNHISITGGTYSGDVNPDCAPGYSAFANGTIPETWTVAKAWFLYYNINGGASGTMDTIIVKQDDPDAQRTVEVEDCGFTGQPDHAFAIWNTKADSTGKSFNPGDLITLISDTTLYAIWKNGYTIYYNNNGGEGVIYQQSKDPGVPVTLDNGANFTKAGQAIYGWNTAADESGDNYGLGGTYNADVTVTMYAVWHDSLSVTNDSTDVICHSENNGTDTVKISGGVIPFQLVLSSTALSKNDTVNITDRTYIYENLKPGAYTVKVSDSVYSVTGTFTIEEPDTLEITALTVPTNNPCPLLGVGEFTASVTAQGGHDSDPYTYSWGNDATDVNADATEVPAKADDIDYTYTVSVKVTDIKGCVATDTAYIEVSPVIVHIDSLHGNTTMKIDTVKQGIMQGCDTIIRNFGYPTFTFNNPAITEDILDTVYNNIPTVYPDSIFSIGYNPIIWTAVDTCGHEVTCEQIIYIYHYPCPTNITLDGYTYQAVRLGCNCWLNENLRAENYSDGRPIDNVMTYVSEDHPNATENANIYGHLYDWYAAADTATNSIADIEATYALGKHIQGICPEGWSLPNDEDFNDFNAYDTKDLRSADNWITTTGGSGVGTNATGFNAQPGGFYNCSTGRFEDLGTTSYYWSCHPVYDMATGAMIAYVCEKLKNTNTVPRCNGFSVRCVLIFED